MSDPFVNGTDRKQRILFPDTLDEYVDENNPVRFIDAFVDSLDIMSLGLKHSGPAGTGRPPYNLVPLPERFSVLSFSILRVPESLAPPHPLPVSVIDCLLESPSHLPPVGAVCA